MPQSHPQIKSRAKKIRSLVVGVMLSLSLVLSLGVFYFVPTKVQAVIPVEDVAQEHRNVTDAILKVLKSAAAVAWKKGLSYFLNKIAYDTAVYIGSGGKGQKPLFISNPGKYLTQVVDGAAGEFLDTEFQSLFGESLCTISFDPAIRLRLGVYAKQTLEPKASCPVTNMAKNFNKISKMSLQDMVDFQHVFDVNSSQIGAYFLIMDETEKAVAKAEAKMRLEQTASSFLGVKDLVTGITKTPKEYINTVANLSIQESTAADKVYTGEPLADAFSLFTNTLINRLYKTIFEKGILPSGSGDSFEMTTSGVSAAKRYFAELVRPTFRARGPVDIVSTLAACPSEYRVTNNCVIDENFADAINRRITVKQALEEGSLNSTGTFGFDQNGQEPEYTNGYPYRSLVILRKYRVIPSTWEAAALYIKNYVVPAQGFGLKELVDLYDDEKWTNPQGVQIDNPFYHLIDPNWVLKAPETYCKKEGPGEQLVADALVQLDDTNNDGVIDSRDTPSRQVERGSYCADERTCIQEAEDGTCLFYGYCAEEKPIWRFSGTACQAYENTCQTFVDSKKKEASFIESTVNHDSCSADNAGCQWYCQNYDNKEKGFVCSSPEHLVNPAEPDYLAAGDQIRLDNNATKCSSGDRGCTEYIPVIAGSNLAANSSFETFAGIVDDNDPDVFAADYSQWKWEFASDAFATTDATDGTYAVRTSGEVAYYFDTESPVYHKKFTASFFAKGACDNVHVEIGGNHTGGAWMNYVDPLDSHRVSADGWSRVVVTGQFGEVGETDPPAPTANPNQVAFKITPNCEITLDGVQLELGDVTAHAMYDTANQAYLKNKAENYISNSSFSIDSGHDYYKDDTNDNYVAGDHLADGWVGTAIDAAQGYGDYYSGSGGYQDVPIVYGTRYDVSAWVKGGGATPLLTECRDKNRAVVADCDLTVVGADPRAQRETNTGRWDFVTFGVEADKPDAAFIRVLLSGGQFDQVSVSLSKDSIACRVDEIGCDMYTPDEKGDKVPAVVTSDDYCPAEFVGCKDYQQMPVSNGTDQALVDRSGILSTTFIATTGKTCDAAYVGCEEYTNLDIVAQGGEGLEYYSAIRRCEQPNPTCATYYRWEGDDVNGFELVAEDLKGGTNAPPEMTPGGACGCDPNDFGCTQYYDQSGNSYYCPMFNTITCSEDCHPLRNTLDNTIYNAIPDQGIRCPANQAACREYRGSTGYNIRKIITDNFDDGDTAGWAGNVTWSTESLKAGGGSAKVTPSMSTAVSELVEDGKDYMIEFWAKAEADDAQITVKFAPNPAIDFVPVAGVTATNENWNHYVLGPAHFIGAPDPAEVLTIEAGAGFFIDNITVWETRDSVYLRYKTYQECPAQWVGCSLYTDSEGNDQYIQSFTNLCRPEKVGCTAAIETNNSTTAFPYEPADKGVRVEADNVRPIVNAAKYKCQAKAKGCEGLGLPSFDVEGRVTKFKTTYLINNPDEYDQTLCTKEETFCDQFQIGADSGSFTQFKQPNAQVCDFRKSLKYQGEVYDAWLKSGTDKFCPVQKYSCIGGNNPGVACFGPGDLASCDGGLCEQYPESPMPTKVCGPRLQETCRGGYRAGEKCNSQVDPKDPLYGCDQAGGNNDGLCSDLTEVCYGGIRAGQACDSDADPNDAAYGCADANSSNDGYCAERICQDDGQCPEGQKCTEYWVGKCQNGASGCSEYRDPQTPSPDKVTPDGVCLAGPSGGQNCKINADCPQSTCVFQGCNANCRAEYNDQGEFYRTDQQCRPYQNGALPPDYLSGCQPYYYIDSTIDSASCAGVVNKDEGCILFNDTTNSQGLTYDSDLTYAKLDTNRGTPETCTGGGCTADSNSVYKVDRDRVCNQWLYCKTSYEVEKSDGSKELTCYDIGNCRQLGTSGQCIKPVGEGQCENDPSRPCLIDADCGLTSHCIRTPKFENATPTVEYMNRLVTPPNHPTDLTFDHKTEVDNSVNYSGYARVGYNWRCSEDPNTVCWRDGICQGGDKDGLLCQKPDDCPGGVCPNNTACDLNNPTYCDQCVGESNVCQVIHGYYPTGSMQEIGIGMNLPNYDFQFKNSSPWEPRNINPPNALKAVEDPLDPTKQNWVMEVGGLTGADSGAKINLDSLIFDNQPLVISLKLRADQDSKIKVQLCYNDDAGPCQVFGTVTATMNWQIFTLPLGNAMVVSGVFKNTYLSIVDAGGNAGLQKFQVDDVMFQTLLEKKSTQMPPELPNDPRFVVRSCRLYPESNSLTCDYTKTTGTARKIYRGWKGYCLETDPQNRSVCLQWWPVDIISGEADDTDQLVGYFGDAPLYYCLQGSFYEFRRPYGLSNGNCNYASHYSCEELGYHRKLCEKAVRGGGHQDKCLYVCVPNEIPDSDVCEYWSHSGGGGENLQYNWWDSNHQNGLNPIAPGVWQPFDGWLSHNHLGEAWPGNIGEVLAFRCDVIGQTVDPSGANKAWAERIKGNYSQIWDLGVTFDDDANPYGSLTYPGSVGHAGNNVTNVPGDPATWDTDYTSVWGNPYEMTKDLGSKYQPIIYLWWDPQQQTGGGSFSPFAQDWGWSPYRGVEHGFDEVDYLSYPRAGVPYSCKHKANKRLYSWGWWTGFRYDRSEITICDDVFPNRYTTTEQFSGPLTPGEPPPPNQPPTNYTATGGGLGLRRIQRIFADVYGVWVWSDGKCVDITTMGCFKANDPQYPFRGTGCENNDECNIGNGVCSGQLCISIDPDNPSPMTPCGCAAGEVCELSQRCSNDPTIPCGLGACPGGGNACVAQRCVGGTDAGSDQCNIANNCPTGSTCLTQGALKKCVSNVPAACDCPNEGSCVNISICRDTGEECNGGQNCSKYCDNNVDGWGDYPGTQCIDDSNCNAGIFCLYANPAQVCWNRPRCSGDHTQTCQPANACPAGYSCNANSKCTYDAVGQCDCRSGFCADGVCSNQATTLCASNNQPTNPCPGGAACLGNADICRLNNARCDAGVCNGGVCEEKERCSTSGLPCGSGSCEVGSSCVDKVCVGGTNAGRPCSGQGDCPEGSCAEAICGWNENGNPPGCGYWCGQACASDSNCTGISGGSCIQYNGICTGGELLGNPCRVGQDAADCCEVPGACAPGVVAECADWECEGGIRSGDNCTLGHIQAQHGQSKQLQYCNGLPDSAPDPTEAKYEPDLSLNSFKAAYSDAFEAMDQCKVHNGSNGMSDNRPNDITGFPFDFCWAQPTVFNIKINGRTGPVQIKNGSGTATVTFNSMVDPEQMPIKKFVVDWGNNHWESFPKNPGIPPRSDPNGPYHTLTHDYTYGDCGAAGGGPDTCFVRVFVEDNWDKGSGYCDNDGTDCSSDLNCGGGTCVGACRGGTTPLNICQNQGQCQGAGAYCNSLFDGSVVITQ